MMNEKKMKPVLLNDDVLDDVSGGSGFSVAETSTASLRTNSGIQTKGTDATGANHYGASALRTQLENCGFGQEKTLLKETFLKTRN